MDSIKDLWRGDIPLKKTFWVYFVLVNGVIGVIYHYRNFHLIDQRFYPTHKAIRELAFYYLSNPNTTFWGIAALLFGIVFVMYQFLIVTSIWRSANKYQGSSVWATHAKAGVILGILISIRDLLIT